MRVPWRRFTSSWPFNAKTTTPPSTTIHRGATLVFPPGANDTRPGGAHLHHEHHLDVVIDAVDDSVVTLADSILVEARKLLAGMRPRLRGEPLDASDDLSAVLVGERLQFLDGQRLDEQAIPCHAGSSPCG